MGPPKLASLSRCFTVWKRVPIAWLTNGDFGAIYSDESSSDEDPKTMLVNCKPPPKVVNKTLARLVKKPLQVAEKKNSSEESSFDEDEPTVVAPKPPTKSAAIPQKVAQELDGIIIR
ncbi:hypothetical protein FQA39_LY11660 [Lamprigera yunnana]|nr:hypothetical protein FQA39_LY11660 [Lamprigera yunnana]